MDNTVTGILKDAFRVKCRYGQVYLIGSIFGDTKHRFKDGARIRTSYITKEEDNNVFVTRNSIYKIENWIN